MKWYSIPPLLCQKIIWLPTRFILKFFGRLQIKGLENLHEIKTNVIFAMNHSSEIDPFLIPASLPFFSRFSPIFYITKDQSFYSNSSWRKYLFGGRFINMWGGYTARTGAQDYAVSLADHVRIIGDRHHFCIFPEGGITPDGSIQPAHGGITYLASHAKCPIVPVAVSGVFKTSARDFFLFRKTLKITFGKPILPEELMANKGEFGDDTVALYKVGALYVMSRVKELLDVN